MNFETTVRIESKIEPSVVYVVKRISVVERANLLMETLNETARATELVELLKNAGDNQGPEIIRARLELDSLMNGKLLSAALRAKLAGIEGLTLNGEAATVESFIQHGPEALVREALEAANAASELTADQQKN